MSTTAPIAPAAMRDLLLLAATKHISSARLTTTLADGRPDGWILSIRGPEQSHRVDNVVLWMSAAPIVGGGVHASLELHGDDGAVSTLLAPRILHALPDAAIPLHDDQRGFLAAALANRWDVSLLRNQLQVRAVAECWQRTSTRDRRQDDWQVTLATTTWEGRTSRPDAVVIAHTRLDGAVPEVCDAAGAIALVSDRAITPAPVARLPRRTKATPDLTWTDWSLTADVAAL